ncbi:response regulator [Aureibaculum conchae]|uniref:response regulator n=1 Tax=Aureibaculum sp. 2308TA14-22 TaxID=3108392 RepID=UPI00339B4B3E
MKVVTTGKPLKNSYSVLIVEDCKLFSDAVKMVLNLIPKNKPRLKFNIVQAFDYESGVTKIQETSSKEFFDVVILDIRLGESKDDKNQSGEKLGELIREHTPKTKIIVITSYNDGFRINSVIKKLNPEGFLIKNNASDQKVLQKAVLKVVSGKTHYCDTVDDILRRKNKYTHKLDDIDIKILYELSNATKMKDMPDYIPLTISGIEKRRRRLKEIFEVDSDRGLILQAKAIGFL